MRLEGIHHVTAITGDAPGNVDFYARVLGLRLVKKTVNQDDPTVYHLFYADERGSAGSDITFFEYPGARRGRAGAGMVHRVVFRVSAEEALDFWEERLRAENVSLSRSEGRLTLADPEGLGLELAVVETADEPLTAEHPEIPAEHRIRGFDSVRAYTQDPETSREFLEGALEFESRGDKEFEARGEPRRHLRLRPDRRARSPRRRDRPPRRVGFEARGARGLAAAGGRGRRLTNAGHRPLLLQVDLLPRAERCPVRDRDDRPGLHDRRAARESRGTPLAAAELRAPPRAGGARSDTDHEPARELGDPLSLAYRTRPAEGGPEGALVLFHGRGTDENDLFPLLDALDPEQRLVGVTPRGPLSLPPGGAHWYELGELGYPPPDSFLPTYELASEFLDGLTAEIGVPPERTVLGGFSQGSMMSYALGLGADRPRPAGILALSGFFPEVEGLEVDLTPPLPPIAIGHGVYDPIIGVEWGRRARERLEEAGADVLYREYPLPHAVDPGFLVELRPWLRSAVSTPTRP